MMSISMDRKIWLLGMFWMIIVIAGFFGEKKALGAPYRVGILMLGDVRSQPVAGFKDGMKALGYVNEGDVVYESRNAEGNRDRLAGLAAEIINGRPNVAVAAGGVEADALKEASADSKVPVVFLAVASAVDRGLVASMARSGNNLTGVDTSDTELTAKRLWFIRKMLPEAKQVLVPFIPDITPSVRAVDVAQSEAPNLGFQIRGLQGGSKKEIAELAGELVSGDMDAIYIGMATPVWQIEGTVFWPISLALGVPIMGINREDLNRGAMAAYACSRYDTGMQAARLVQKIFKGISPSDIPVETPSRLEFVVNRWVVDRLGISLPKQIWRLADDVVSIPVE